VYVSSPDPPARCWPSIRIDVDAVESEWTATFASATEEVRRVVRVERAAD